MKHQDMPAGFVMALAHNPKAMLKFANLSEEQRQEIITQTHTIDSKQKMQSFVNSLVEK